MNIKATIEGVTPLLCNRFTDEAAEAATSGRRKSNVGHRGSPREQAERKLYLDESGRPGIPQPNLFRSIMDGGKFFKAGKSKITTIKSSLIPACLDLHGLIFPIVHRDPWDVDVRPVRIPATGGRILTYRPCFQDWSISFEMTLDTEELDGRTLRDVVDAAGKKIGLGDFRPDCKGPFGKFVITQWETQP